VSKINFENCPPPDIKPVDVETDYESVWESVQEAAELTAPAEEAEDEDDIFGAFDEAEAEDPKGTDAEAAEEMAADTASAESATTPDAGTALESASESTADDPKPAEPVDAPAAPATVETQNTSTAEAVDATGQTTEPIRTEAGLIDPETGELIEESLIMRKFGWSEMPQLPKDATKEQVAQYQQQLDQVLDLVCGYRERTSRWRAAAELRSKGLDKAADFFTANFIEPMSRALAPHILPVYKSGKKKGEFSKKTMVLSSGAVKFTAGGGYHVHDKDLIREHIEKTGLENFAAIGAHATIVWDHNKLMAALKNGVLKDIPGTGHKAVTPFAKVAVVNPQAPDQKEDEEDA
jgi:hypothetical protein